jgi:hypothetical protein
MTVKEEDLVMPHVVGKRKDNKPAHITRISNGEPETSETDAPQTYVNQTKKNDRAFFANLRKHRPPPQNKGPLQLVPTLHGGGFVSAGLPEPDPFEDLSEAERKLVEAALEAFSNRNASAQKTAEENLTAENVETVEAQEATGEAQSLTQAVNVAANPVAAKKARSPSKKKKPVIIQAGDDLDEEILIEDDNDGVREVLGSSGFHLVAGADENDYSM